MDLAEAARRANTPTTRDNILDALEWLQRETTTRQYALENPAWGNGAFTKALVEGLSGQARTSGQQKITMKTLDAYVAERVKALTEGKQSPVTVYPPNVPDFPLAMTR